MTEQREIVAAEPPLDCRVGQPDQAAFEKLADALAPLMVGQSYAPTFKGGYDAGLTEARVRQIVREELAALVVPNAKITGRTLAQNEADGA